MPAYETYLLHLYRSRAIRSWRWVARLEHLPAGASTRFTDLEALLAYLRTVVRTGNQPAPSPQEGGESPRNAREQTR